MKKIILTAVSLSALILSTNAAVVAQWDFTSATPLTDTIGSSNFTAGTGMSFDGGTGAIFNGTSNGTLSYNYNAAIEPGAIAAGETWSLSLTGITFNTLGGYDALFNSRSGNGQGLIVYRVSSSRFAIWMGNGTDGWHKLQATTLVTTGTSYDLVASWDGSVMSLDVTGGMVESLTSGPITSTGFNESPKSIFFGSGNDNQDNHYFDGTMTSASISIVPETSTYALLAGLSALTFIMVRRRKA